MNKPVIDGFVFQYARDTERAKKEYETMQKVKSKINIEDTENTLKLYKKLVDKRYFVTPVGLTFLRDMRDYLISLNLEEEIPPIYVIGVETATKTENPFDAANYAKMKKENERLHLLKKKMSIAIAAMVIIILGMFFIVVTNDNIGYFNAEEKVVDKYSAWQERLQNWEDELIEREDELNKREEALGN